MAQLRPDQPPPTPTPHPPAKQPNTRLRLALLLAGVAIYILFLATPLLGRVMGGSSRLDVPYSVLKAQAADNNIKDLTLQGQQATGDFNTAVSYQGVSNTAFTSTTPEPGADPSLYTLLDQNHVSYSVKEATGGWTGLLINFLPFVALIALWVWILRRSGQATQGIFSFGRSRARIQEPGSPKTTFNDVAGVEQAQYELQEIVDFLREPQKFQRLGGRMPKGVLLIGTPGTGKTLLARAVAVLAASNRADVLDPALLRPGRFDRRIVVDIPDRRGRQAILKVHTRGVPLADDVELDVIARSTPGLVGADLANLVNEAALHASRTNRTAVTMQDFEDAFDRVVLGAERKIYLSESERRVIAYHESGHALVAWYQPHADPVHKITIVPRGQALGVTQSLPTDDRHNLSEEYLKARLAMALGGRAAEQIALGSITTGAQNDLETATA